jgi:hypothetical protein
VLSLYVIQLTGATAGYLRHRALGE